jgi:uncharacterized lipoprotein YddW (UPF0748 family)
MPTVSRGTAPQRPSHPLKLAHAALMLAVTLALPALAGAAPATLSTPAAEVRGTWVTTTANGAIASPAASAATMRRLRDIGLNTVYVESWKNGYTQFPSDVLEKTIGVRQRPAPMPQDPSDTLAQRQAPARDLLQETLIEAHRNGLIYVSWFEYGFMAAYKDTINHLRRQKPEWLSRDIAGNEVAPNGFVWMNPLHPEARRFLLDLVLEAVDKYDIDGIQLDDRIVWPYVTMGYDDYTRKVYAGEHDGRQPPDDFRDAEWMRWRADKVDAFAQQFVRELRARRPSLLISLSPAVHPWAWEHYLLDWPRWSGWSAGDSAGTASAPRWDEFIPQAYRNSYAAFAQTWRDQAAAVRATGGDRQRDLVAGIRIVGDGPDSSWDQLRQSIELTRSMGNGGHVLWYSRGVTDLYAGQLTAFYRDSGAAAHPFFGPRWRQPSVPLQQLHARANASREGSVQWRVPAMPAGRYRLIGHDGQAWRSLDLLAAGVRQVRLPGRYTQVELLRERRGERPVRMFTQQ